MKINKLHLSVVMMAISVILFYWLYQLYQYLKKRRNIKNKTIVSNIGEPYLMEESISPLPVVLTADVEGENGGLSYLKENTQEDNIKLIHDYYKMKNYELTKDTNIIFGAGTTMMVAALYYALQKKLKKTLTVTTNADVFYYLHKHITYSSNDVKWISSNGSADLYVIVSPSNPLGIITSPASISSKYKLFDIVYDKKIFTGSHKSVNEELYEQFKIDDTIFIANSFSKLGVPGARFGYLLTRDPEIAEYCEEYVRYNSIRYPTAGATISRIAFYRYFNKEEWNQYIYKTLKKRRDFFYYNSEKHGIKIYSKNDILPYIYTNKSVDWWMSRFNIETRKGSDFNDADDNSRFNLMLSTEYWDEFERRFKV